MRTGHKEKMSLSHYSKYYKTKVISFYYEIKTIKLFNKDTKSNWYQMI